VSAPTDFVIVQHADKDSGAGDVGLSPRGREQAEGVAQRLADLPITAVYASHGGATVDLLRTPYGDDYVREAAAGVIEQGVPHCALTHLRLENGKITPVAIASQRALHPPESGRSL
jgi:hypothetical protein